MIKSPYSRAAISSRFGEWRKKRGNQAGALAASKVLMDGSAGDDPWGALSKSIIAYYQGKAQDNELAKKEGERDALLAREQTRQDSKDAMDIEQFELNKQVAKAKLSEDQARREAIEESRLATLEHLKTLPVEDQKLLLPYVADQDKYFKVIDDIGDDRRQEAQFEKTFGESTRHNKVTESNTAASLANERQRIRLTEEGMTLKSGKQTMKKMGNLIIITDAMGREVSREALPENPAERRNAAIRIGRDNMLSPAESAKVLSELDAELGIDTKTSRDRSSPNPNPGNPGGEAGTDEELLAAIQTTREAGLSDEEIMRSLAGTMSAARIMRLMRRR